MKKIVVLMAAVFVLFGMVGMASAIFVEVGEYSYSGPLGDGKWYETYGGGGEGQPGSILWAMSNNSVAGKEVYTPTWSIYKLNFDQIIGQTSLLGGGTEYTTRYNGVPDSYGAFGWYYEPDTMSKWTLITSLTAFVVAEKDKDNKYVRGHVTLEGFQISSHDPPFIMTADLSEEGPLTNTLYGGHWGNVTGIHVGVPEPATMLLLGLGLMGIAGLRRKS